MVREVETEERTLFRCEACGLHYEGRELAQKCEDFCREHNSCSVEITRHAVKVKE